MPYCVCTRRTLAHAPPAPTACEQAQEGRSYKNMQEQILCGPMVRPRASRDDQEKRQTNKQGGLCQLKQRHRNTDSKIGPGGKKNRPETEGKPPENQRNNKNKTRKPTETQGPCPDLRGFYIKTLAVLHLHLKNISACSSGPNSMRTSTGRAQLQEHAGRDPVWTHSAASCLPR